MRFGIGGRRIMPIILRVGCRGLRGRWMEGVGMIFTADLFALWSSLCRVLLYGLGG